MKFGCIFFALVLLMMPVMGYSQENPEAFFENVQKLVRSEKPGEAIRLLEEYNKRHETDIRGYLMLAQIYILMGGPVNRSRAEQCYIEAQKRAPNNKDVLKKLANLKNQQGFQTSADDYLKRVLEVDPLDFEVNYSLLQKYIGMVDKNNIQKLESRFSNLAREFPNNQNAKLLLGMIYLGLDRFQEALQVLVEAANLDPTNAIIHKYISEIYYRVKNYDKFTQHYILYLKNLKDPKDLNREFVSTEIIMNGTNRIEYFKLPVEERGNYLARYWQELDPNPITIQNERLIEHKTRVDYAQKFYRTNVNTLGYDDRGKTYVKYGPPDDKYIDASVANARGNESWTYFSLDPNLSFDFVEYGGFYREAMTLMEAVKAYGTYRQDPEVAATLQYLQSLSMPGVDANLLQEQIDEAQQDYLDKYIVAQELYRNRTHLGGIYARMGTVPYSTFEIELNQEVIQRKLDGRSAEPRYRMVRRFEKLDFGLQMAQFRGKEDLTKLETYVGIPLHQFSIVPNEDSSTTFSFLEDYVLFDSSNNRIAHQQFRQRQANLPGEDYSNRTVVAQKNAFLPPGKYRLAYQVVETSSKTADMVAVDVNVKDFSGSKLMVSDIQFSPRIYSVQKDTISTKNNLFIQPYPFRYVEQGTSIYAYFEIYNLILTPNGNTKYQVSLKMEQEDTKGNFVIKSLKDFGKIFGGKNFQTIESTYQREGTESSTLETIALDFTKLPKGNSRLTVIVKDLNTGTEGSSDIEFQLIDKEKKENKGKTKPELAKKNEGKEKAK